MTIEQGVVRRCAPHLSYFDIGEYAYYYRLPPPSLAGEVVLYLWAFELLETLLSCLLSDWGWRCLRPGTNHPKGSRQDD